MKYTPTIYAEALLSQMKKGEVPQRAIKNFLNLLRKKRDLNKLSDIVKKFEVLQRKQSGITKVEVFSTRDIKKEVGPILKTKFGTNLEVSYNIDPTLIGGVILQINDEELIDGSIKRRLEKLFR